MSLTYKISLEEHTRIKNTALDAISRGHFRWCSGGICACMGCVNRLMTKSEYDYANSIQEVKDAIARSSNRQTINQFWKLYSNKRVVERNGNTLSPSLYTCK